MHCSCNTRPEKVERHSSCHIRNVKRHAVTQMQCGATRSLETETNICHAEPNICAFNCIMTMHTWLLWQTGRTLVSSVDLSFNKTTETAQATTVLQLEQQQERKQLRQKQLLNSGRMSVLVCVLTRFWHLQQMSQKPSKRKPGCNHAV